VSGKSGSGCLKGLGVGCGSCFLLVVILAASVWAGWGSFREMGIFRKVRTTFETAKSEVVNLNALRASLDEIYPAARIDTHADIQSTNGVTVKTLAVSIVDPRFALPDSESAKEAKAREIAGKIAEIYPSIDRWDRLRLSLVREGDGGANLGSTSTFQYGVPELLGRPPVPTSPSAPSL
jgi:hypothetical protein